MTERTRNKLRQGEQKRPNGSYAYRWTDTAGVRRTIYAKTLAELRVQEAELNRDRMDGIREESRYKTLNNVFDAWCQLKRGLKDNTFQNYKYMYNMFVAPSLGKRKITDLVKSDVKRFYNRLVDERGLSVNTVDNIHTVLHQVLEMAVDDNYLRHNPSNNVLKELKQTRNSTEKRHPLTKAQQEIFLKYLKGSAKYKHWYPAFAVMIGTGMRVGETVGLRWCDIDLEEGIIDINHTLVFYKHAVDGFYCNIHTPKTKNGVRKIPMLSFVKEAFFEERRNQEAAGIHCKKIVDGYTDFIFINRFGEPQHQGTLNKALRRITRDCNDDILMKEKKDSILLPHFSCHSLRHTFTTRMCEAGVNIKVIQDILGHSDVSTTLNIYAEATKELKKSEFANLEDYWNANSMV